MNETKYNGSDTENWKAPQESPEEVDENGFTAQQRELMEQWLPNYEQSETPAIEQREAQLEIEQLEEMFELFEQEYDLEELRGITFDDLDTQEDGERNHPLRDAAKKDLIPIDRLLKTLKQETDITAEQYEELYNRYSILTKAVGVVNNGKIDR